MKELCLHWSKWLSPKSTLTFVQKFRTKCFNWRVAMLMHDCLRFLRFLESSRMPKKNKKKTIKVGTFSKYRKTINYFEWPFSPICTDFRMGTKYEFWLHLKIDLNYRIICRTCSLHIIYLYYTYMYLVGHEYKLHC